VTYGSGMRQAFRKARLTIHESLDGFRYPYNQQA
jgi:hypothetical protein